MTPLKINHPGGVREVRVYRMPERERTFARDALRASYVRGDGTENPSTLTVEVELVGTDLQSATSLAYSIIEEAQNATFVTTHRGRFEVDKLQSHRLRGDGLAVRLRLVWRRVQRGIIVFGWDRTDVTLDQTDVTLDAETIEA